MKTGKRVLSVLLALLLLAVSVPFVIAEGEPEEPTDWIEIYTYEDLDDVRYNLTANYKLMNDIDMTEWVKPDGEYDYFGNGWNPIGSKDVYADDAFSGIFDGNGHSVSGLQMDVTKFPAGTGEGVFFGLFSCISGIVRNLVVEGSIKVTDVRKTNYVGGIAAVLNKTGIIENCSNLISIAINTNTNNSSYYNYIGGIVGKSDGLINSCQNAADVQVYSSGSFSYSYNYIYYNRVAGITGNAFSDATISNCINIGRIESTNEFSKRHDYNSVSGIANSDIAIVNCYNIGLVLGGEGNYAISDHSSTNCFYLRGSGASYAGAVERTDAQMKRQITFQNWDFDNVWTMEGRDDYFYPELRNAPLVLPDDFKTPIGGSVKINGTQEADSVLTADISELTPENATVAYSWTIDGAEVSATDSYQVAEANLGKTLMLTVSGTGDYKGALTASCVLGAPHEHTSGESTIENGVPATCTEAGSYDEVYYCTACNEEISRETKTIDSLGHAEKTSSTASTCTENGFTVTYCTRCGETLSCKVLPRLEHDWNDGVVTKKPSCTETGIMTYTCATGGETRTEPIDKLDHSIVKIEGTAPTCTKSGLSDGLKCEACQKWFVEQQVINPLGHAELNENGDCPRCGKHVKDIEKPSNPATDESDKDPEPSGKVCKYCGEVHEGFFDKIIGFFHSILALFGLRK